MLLVCIHIDFLAPILSVPHCNVWHIPRIQTVSEHGCLRIFLEFSHLIFISLGICIPGSGSLFNIDNQEVLDLPLLQLECLYLLLQIEFTCRVLRYSTTHVQGLTGL